VTPHYSVRAVAFPALRAAMRLLATACAAALISACATLPPGAEFPREPSRALETPQETKLGKLTQGWSAAHGGLSGFRLLPGGIDSFSLRAEMADAAERTLDAQYFILHGDDTGRLFIRRLLAAADRGVRVRILLDDANTVGGDRRIVALAAHPKIEVRLFNPFRLSAPILRQTNLALEAQRLSRRMHNKVLITDNAIAVAGGRNIGDEYFAANRAFEFGDFDVFVAGPPAVTRLSRSFDTYWNDALSIPAEALTDATPGSLEAYRKELDEHGNRMADSDYERHVREGTPLNRIVAGTSPLVFARARVLYDSPDKAKPDADADDPRTLRDELMGACRATRSELMIVTPYLVPGESQLAMLRELRARGVRVRILTNSLASTDVPVVHAGYRKVRLPLVQMGVELFEVKPQLGQPQVGHTTLSYEAGEQFSLHAKVFVFDRQRVFVGSANFDMRSLHLNTEVGLIIDSAELARQAAERFEAITIPANSYQVKTATRLGEPAVAWITENDGKLVELDHEPGANFAREFVVNAVSILPIDNQL
jgi:cardiolipin synthase C